MTPQDKHLIGTAASQGIGIGRAVIYDNQRVKVIDRLIEKKEEEVARVERAVEEAAEAVEALYETTRNTLGEEEAAIFEAHKWMLLDPEWNTGIRDQILQEEKCAEVAVDRTTATFVEMLSALDDPYLRARAADLQDVSERVLKILLKIETVDLRSLQGPAILVADDLHPSDTIALNPEAIEGIVTRLGSETSHSAIIARSLGIPAVMGVDNLLGSVEMDQLMIVDGDEGKVLVDPPEDIHTTYREKMREQEAFRTGLEVFRGKRTQTFDGKKVELVCNIGRVEDTGLVGQEDGEGIGLFRSEFVYFDRAKAPDEAEQYAIYKAVLEGVEGKPVIIRTLDAGGDKDIAYLNLPQEMNPFLGYRAIRVCLERKDLFKTQLRAILRASAHGKAKIMFPMISTLTELVEAKAILQEAREELTSEGIPFDPDLEVGIMIEIPSAAIIADQLAAQVDFFSIGTNDLTQYTMAADRMNPAVKGLYKPHQPAVIRLIDRVISAGHDAGIWVGMCGEAAASPIMIPLLVAMGLDEFSVSASSILKTRWMLSRFDRNSSKVLLEEVLRLDSAEAIEKTVQKYLKEKGIHGKEDHDSI